MFDEDTKPFDPVAHLNACFEKPSRRVASGRFVPWTSDLMCNRNADLVKAHLEDNGGYEQLARSQTLEEVWLDASNMKWKLEVVRTWRRIAEPLPNSAETTER